MVKYSYDCRAKQKGQLQTWLEKSPAVDDGTRGFKKMVNLAKKLDEDVQSLNADDRWTLNSEYEEFKNLAKKYVGYKPKTYDSML